MPLPMMSAPALAYTVASKGNRFALVVQGSAVEYRYPRGARALHDVQFSWPDGFVALLGPNGAGKSTLLSLLVGARRMQQGTIDLGDQASVGYVPQLADWPGRFTVSELLSYAGWWHGVPRSSRPERVAAALRAMDLLEVADDQLSSLSGGYHRRAMIAQALVHEPAVLVLDEPSAGLDPRQRIHLRTLLDRLAQDRTVVVATHLVEDDEAVAGWLSVMDRGRMVFDGSMDDVRQRWGKEGHGSALESAHMSLVP